MAERLRCLVVAAHADDETLGAACTILQLARSGAEIDLLVLADGETARLGATAGDLSRRRDQCWQATRLLGIRKVTFADYPDNGLDQVPMLDLARLVEDRIVRLKPDRILTHSAHDLNVDHRAAFEAVVTATRPGSDSAVREIYSFESPSSTEWSFGLPPFEPNVFVSVSPTDLETKLAALACYAGEARPFPHPRSPEAITALARYRGAQSGHQMAEAFRLVRSLEWRLRSE